MTSCRTICGRSEHDFEEIGPSAVGDRHVLEGMVGVERSFIEGANCFRSTNCVDFMRRTLGVWLLMFSAGFFMGA